MLRRRYYAAGLYYYRRKDYKNKKYPEGIVTAENIAKEGGELGERISELDSPAMLKAFGPWRGCVTIRRKSHGLSVSRSAGRLMRAYMHVWRAVPLSG